MQLFCFFSGTQKRYFVLNLSVVVLCVAVILSSCITTKSNYYFKTLSKDTSISGFVGRSFDSKIQKKDILAITVSSLSREMDERFNIAAASRAGDANSLQSSAGFLVDEKGMIMLHFVGNILAEGRTRKELREKLQNDLLPYMKEPIVTVQYLNHRVTVLGEVIKPQVLNMPEEHMSLLDVIVVSGDLKENASRKDIMVIRDTGNGKTIKHLNLEDHSIFLSPYYYVKPDDIVYVLPDHEKYIKEDRRRNFQTTFSLLASGISLIVTILNALLR